MRIKNASIVGRITMALSGPSLLSRLGSLHKLVNISAATKQHQCLSRCVSQLASRPNVLAGRLCAPVVNSYSVTRSFHTSQPHHVAKRTKTRVYEDRNKLVFPPQLPEEPRRPAEIFFSKKQIKYSQRKMWYVAKFVKGMRIDDAISQLALINKKGARIVREFLIEAQEEAVTKHHVEYKSNMHIADSFTGKGTYEHAIRYHGRGFKYQLDLVYCHYYFSLKEGPPPEEPPFTGYDHAQRYMDRLRWRYVRGSL